MIFLIFLDFWKKWPKSVFSWFLENDQNQCFLAPTVTERSLVNLSGTVSQWTAGYGRWCQGGRGTRGMGWVVPVPIPCGTPWYGSGCVLTLCPHCISTVRHHFPLSDTISHCQTPFSRIFGYFPWFSAIFRDFRLFSGFSVSIGGVRLGVANLLGVFWDILKKITENSWKSDILTIFWSIRSVGDIFRHFGHFRWFSWILWNFPFSHHPLGLDRVFWSEKCSFANDHFLGQKSV